jgi:hypothetical protein
VLSAEAVQELNSIIVVLFVGVYIKGQRTLPLRKPFEFSVLAT